MKTLMSILFCSATAVGTVVAFLALPKVVVVAWILILICLGL